MIAAVFMVLLVGCGDDPGRKTSSPARSASTDRYVQIQEAISPYLGAMIDQPATVADGDLIATAVERLERIAGTASRACARSLRRVERAVQRTNLSPQSKRKRILDAAAPSYAEC